MNALVAGLQALTQTRARAICGPAVRRVHRELQWRRCGSALYLKPGPAELCRYPVTHHETPLFRRLAGVDQQLQRNKVVNLGIAVTPLDGLILAPGQRFSFW